MRAIMLVISDRRLCKNKHMKTDVVVPKNLYVYVYFDIVQTIYSACSPNIGKPGAAPENLSLT